MEVNDVIAQEVLYKVTVVTALVYNNPCAITINFSTSCAITLNLTI